MHSLGTSACREEATSGAKRRTCPAVANAVRRRGGAHGVSAEALEDGLRAAGAPALIALSADRLELDEDDVAAATRRGLLLAAAGGDPSEGIGPGSRAALETAAELQALGIGARLTEQLEALAADGEAPVAAALARTLADDPAMALGTLAAVLL